MAEAVNAAFTSLLAVKGLNAWYGESHILHGVDFEVRGGEVVTLLGRNGAGKTTTLKSIMGMVERREGSVRFRGCRDHRLDLEPDRAPRHRHLPGGARHLRQPRTSRRTCCCRRRCAPGGLSLEQIYELFPNLKERLKSQGTKLSGGEQQMLAIGRILRTGAQLLLLDEPTEGLAPVIVQQIGRTIARLKARGLHHPAGRAELPLRRDRRGPALRDGERPRGRHDPQRGAGGEHGQAARVPGRLTRDSMIFHRREAMKLKRTLHRGGRSPRACRRPRRPRCPTASSRSAS